MTEQQYDSGLEPESPRPGSPVKPLSPKPIIALGKKQLSSAQKASLARAREKARQSKLAKSQAKAEQEKEFAKFQEKTTKPASPVRQASDTEMSETDSEPSPIPVPKKKKKHPKKKRKQASSSDSETSEDDPVDAKQRAADHAALAKSVYENHLARYKGEVVYKSLFPYLNGP